MEEITICNRRGTPSKLLRFSSSEVSSSQKGQCIAEMLGSADADAGCCAREKV